DEALMDALSAIPAAAAMEEGLVSPAPLVIDTCPCEQGSQRVPDATTLYKAQKTPWRSSQTSRRRAADEPRSSRVTPRQGAKKSHAVLWPPMPRARSRLGAMGAPHSTAAPGAGRAHDRTGAASPATPGPGDHAERRPAPAWSRGVQRGAAQPCAPPH